MILYVGEIAARSNTGIGAVESSAIKWKPSTKKIKRLPGKGGMGIHANNKQFEGYQILECDAMQSVLFVP
jgi:hypothetical protein